MIRPLWTKEEGELKKWPQCETINTKKRLSETHRGLNKNRNVSANHSIWVKFKRGCEFPSKLRFLGHFLGGFENKEVKEFSNLSGDRNTSSGRGETEKEKLVEICQVKGKIGFSFQGRNRA